MCKSVSSLCSHIKRIYVLNVCLHHMEYVCSRVQSVFTYWMCAYIIWTVCSHIEYVFSYWICVYVLNVCLHNMECVFTNSDCVYMLNVFSLCEYALNVCSHRTECVFTIKCMICTLNMCLHTVISHIFASRRVEGKTHVQSVPEYVFTYVDVWCMWNACLAYKMNEKLKSVLSLWPLSFCRTFA